MTADPCLMPIGYGALCPLPGDHDGGCAVATRRCYCGRPVGALSTCGCCCAEHDDPIAEAKRRHPAGKGIDVPQTADIQDYLRQKGEIQ